MFTDMVGYSALTQRSEANALAMLAEHEGLLRGIFPVHAGREISTIGDAFLVEFDSALDAVHCAVAIQQALVERNARHPDRDPIMLRIGIHLGDIVHTADDVLGDGVNIAARIHPCAEPQGICISEDVARQIRNTIEFPLKRLPRRSLKNIDLAVDLYAIELPWLRGAHPRTAPRPTGGSRRLLWWSVAAGALLTGLAVWFLTSRFSGASEAGRFRLGIVPFELAAPDSLTRDWPILIQTLVVGEITGMDRIAVIHDLSVNGLLESSVGGASSERSERFYGALDTAHPDLIVDGAIVRSGTGITLQMKLVDPGTREILHTATAPCSSLDDLADAVRILAKEVVDYLELKVFRTHQDVTLTPWITTKNMTALTSFIQASSFMYHFDPAAEKHLRRAIELDSLFLSARVWLISLLMKRGDSVEAEGHLAFLHRYEPTANPFEQVMIAWVDAFLRGDAAGQIRSLRMALEYSPNNNILLFLLARLHYMSAAYRECIDALTPAIAMKWPYSPAWYLLAVCHHELGDDATARRILEESLSIQPAYQGIPLLLSTLCMRTGDLAAAERYEQLYLRIASENGLSPFTTWVELGDARAVEQVWGEAASAYRQALDCDTRAAGVHRRLADALIAMRDTSAARSEYQTAVQLDARDAASHLALGRIEEWRGAQQAARRHYRSFLRLDSTSVEALDLRRRLTDR